MEATSRFSVAHFEVVNEPNNSKLFPPANFHSRGPFPLPVPPPPRPPASSGPQPPSAPALSEVERAKLAQRILTSSESLSSPEWDLACHCCSTTFKRAAESPLDAESLQALRYLNGLAEGCGEALTPATNKCHLAQRALEHGVDPDVAHDLESLVYDGDVGVEYAMRRERTDEERSLDGCAGYVAALQVMQSARSTGVPSSAESELAYRLGTDLSSILSSRPPSSLPVRPSSLQAALAHLRR